jgi:hypothetical protein
MGALKRVSNGSKQPLQVTLTFILAIVGLLILLQSLVWSAGRAAVVIHAQDSLPVVTSTLTTQEKIEAYINAHIIQGDVMPSPTPDTGVIKEPQVGITDPVSYSVALLSDMTQIGVPGETVTYTLVLSNSGTLSDVYGITGASAWPLTIPVDVFTVTTGTTAHVTVAVAVPPGASDGDSDTAVITATSRADSSVSASVLLTTMVGSYKLYLPLINVPLPPPSVPVLSATRPNSANDWHMNWTISDNSSLTGYELQQSQDATFATGVTTYSPAGSATSQLIDTVQASANNVYYYRIRALRSGQMSDWSNVVKVVGAYYDEFTSNQTGWSGPSLKEGLRRLTFIEEIDSWYEIGEWLILRVEDSWDWAIASPLMPAPQPPYAIEFRSKPANLGNLVSHGVVFGADWTGAPCPDWSTVLGVYAHDNCFNHFYNTNLIWSSDTDLTLLWERIDTLVWCPNCGGSPLKRLGHTQVVNFHPDASDWNDYRVEVRSSEIKFYLNGDLRYTYSDTRWINEPYFGVFASADEYSNSTWRWEYYKITPLDN